LYSPVRLPRYCEGPGYYRGPVWNELQLAHAGTACDSFDPNVAAAATSTTITTMSARNFMLLVSVWERWPPLVCVLLERQLRSTGRANTFGSRRH